MSEEEREAAEKYAGNSPLWTPQEYFLAGVAWQKARTDKALEAADELADAANQMSNGPGYFERLDTALDALGEGGER